MKVESSIVMFQAFQSCRHLLPEMAFHVRALVSVLDAVRKQDTFVVDVPESILGSLVELGPVRSALTDVRFPAEAAGALVHSTVFAAIEVGALELERLIAAGSSKPVSSLGYALHVLPDLVRSPDELRPESFAFNFSIAARHWDELSAAMRNALGAAVGQERAAAILKKLQTEQSPPNSGFSGLQQTPPSRSLGRRS